jgi:hypothetical protein
LKGASHEEVINNVVAEVVMSGTVADEAMKYVDLERMECGDTHIFGIAAKSLAEPPETCRPQEGLKSEAPKHPEILGWTIRRAPHGEAFIPDVKILGVQSRLTGLREHTDLGRSRI